MQCIQQPLYSFATTFMFFKNKNKMKKSVIVWLCAVLMSVSAYAQFIPAAKVPSPVKKTLMIKYPKAAEVEWEKIEASYLAMFSNGDDWTEATFSATGVWQKTSVNIDPEKLPAALGLTVKKGNPNFDISSVIRKDVAAGPPTYEIILDSETESYTALYKADGTLLSKVKAEEGEESEEYEESDSYDGDY